MIEQLWQEAQNKRKQRKNKIYDTDTEECYLCHADTIPVIRFSAYREMPFINAAFSTRFGGISQGALGELNLGFSRGDTAETVEKNYEIFCRAIHVNMDNLVLSDQIHDTKVSYVTKKDACNGILRKKLQGVDGIYTDQKGICLATSYADCVPLFFVDPVRRIIASSHSGWRGTVGKIGAKTVAAMERKFCSKREDLIAVIGPSICQECYEVSSDVIAAFENAYSEEQMAQISFCSDPERQKYQLDLWAANYLQLIEEGLFPQHIHVAGICTCCNDKLLFSHRASKGRRGNLNGFLCLT